MEKVKVTREIADAIKFGIKHHSKDDIVRAHTNVKGWRLVCELKPLRHMPLDRLIKALYIGYEVEETFKVGDWVVDVYEGITRIDSKEKEGLWIGEGTLTWVNYDGECYERLRHATPEEIAKEKQRRWWAKHGRDVWELSLYDSVITKEGHPFTISYIYRDYSGGTVKYELNNGAYYDKDDMEDKFKILYFAEDRKDIEQ